VDRLLGIVEPDVHVHAEDELLPRDEPQRLDQVAVARARDDPLVLPHGERVRARRADRQPAALGGAADLRAQRPQLVAGLGDRLARVGRDLEHRLHELGLDLPLAGVLEELLDRVDEPEGLAVADHQLFLDTDREAA
jgi:hypothetical protein